MLLNLQISATVPIVFFFFFLFIFLCYTCCFNLCKNKCIHFQKEKPAENGNAVLEEKTEKTNGKVEDEKPAEKPAENGDEKKEKAEENGDGGDSSEDEELGNLMILFALQLTSSGVLGRVAIGWSPSSNIFLERLKTFAHCFWAFPSKLIPQNFSRLIVC